MPLAATGGLLLASSCARHPNASDVSVDWTAGPTPLKAATAIVADLTLRDAARRPVQGAKIRIEGYMSHPGMAPVLAAAEERGNGVYRVRFQLTMAGDWVVLVKGSLPDGRALNRRIDVTHVQPSG